MQKEINFKNYSSIKIGSKISVRILEDDFTQLEKYYLIGSCNNTLVSDNPPPLMMLSKKYDYIHIDGGGLHIGGATPSGKIASFCKKHNIGNFEFLAHLPGKLGGLVCMNAGLKEYEIFNYLTHISTHKKRLIKTQVEYGYRYTNICDPILEASFELSYGYDVKKLEMFKKMRNNQPSTPSAGSCFKNPPNNYAGKLIEECGLKAKRRGGMEFSSKHANFLVNCGNGTFEDALFLVKEAKKRVFEKFAISLECEIVILDRAYMSENHSYIKSAT